MRRYAAAWGILIGAAIGTAIGLPLHASAELSVTFSLVGLIIGHVVSQRPRRVTGPSEAALRPDAAERLKELDRLRSGSLITEEEYQTKRKQILNEI